MQRLARRHDRTTPSSLVIVVVGMAAAYLLLLAWAMGRLSFNVWGAMVVAPVILVLTVPFARRATRAENDPTIGRIIMIACGLKLVGALVRYAVTFSLYGTGDADGYHAVGTRLAPMFRHGDFAVDIGRRVIGTGFIDLVTGGIYTVTGASKLAGYFVFSWLGFLGLYCFYRAFRLAFPEGDGRRYAYLVFFMPSLLFWPSSIGKESWMMLTLGLTSYGAARMLTGKNFGFVMFVLGLTGMTMVRPHVALLAIVALFAAYLLRRSPKPSLLGLPAKLLVLGILAVGTVIVLSQLTTFFGVKSIDTGSAQQILNHTTQQSTQGGSAVEVTRPSSPFGIAYAAISVVFRPWPYEAGNVQGLAASLEGVVLLGLAVTSLKRLASVPRAMLQRPYVAFALVYSLIFAYAFSAIGNFGILSRERVQLYPLLFVLLCVPAGFGRDGSGAGKRTKKKRGPRGRDPFPEPQSREPASRRSRAVVGAASGPANAELVPKVQGAPLA
jgi:hypothetical protein